ncbi:hypothetical protein GOP47_0017202 [Adiantum capillus-veneris]|uniref:Uncharacterized protein n=1 Tax=Adiantum capillus-veneris TaxID=13818 RepID=A0A9D4ZCE3_ADICA|nr:hypothetical protein GOP47_0017202 [Adiantum capillus-veneris]
MRSSFTELLHQKLMLQDNPPVCLLIDSVFGWGDAIAIKFGLSRVDVWTSSASTLCLGIHLPGLVERGFIPAAEEGAKDKIIDFITGLSPLRVADLSQNLRAEEGLLSDSFVLISSIFENAKKADRILVNTMHALERSVIEALRKEDRIPINRIGPLYMMSNIVPYSSSLSLIQEDNDCLLWLDRQQGSSVLYIAFGSVASLDENALVELARGLEASGQSFLWVILPDTYKNKASVEEILPEGFMERTHNRGLVISWAPQLAVLGHSSVGAFLTHADGTRSWRA